MSESPRCSDSSSAPRFGWRLNPVCRAVPQLALIAAVVLAAPGPARAEQTVGLFLNDEASFDGYTLFTPMGYTSTYLINNEGKLVHSWSSQHVAGGTAYLLENGELLRVERPRGTGLGRVKKYAWDGTVLWDVVYNDDEHMQHHDVEPLPNGNVLMITWEVKTELEAIEAGRNPATVSDVFWPLRVIEVEPVGASDGNIVWEWHAWDHLVQDFDPTKANFGVVADNPGLIDINYFWFSGGEDWLHTNAIDYNEALDQIVLSAAGLSEIWIIDHSTTSEEAADHTGGNSGKGGDLLYRWGNPAAYDRGEEADQKLFLQHDARWIEPGHPGTGNLTLFNNYAHLEAGAPPGSFSAVLEIEPPIDGNGNYTLPDGAAYGPEEPMWTYTADPPEDLFGSNTSGAYRLPNGNTLICEGPDGVFLEVTLEGDVVWHYVNPGSSNTQQGESGSAWTFRTHRYAPDYPGLAGQDLTPGYPIESFNEPFSVPDGSGATQPLTCQRTTADGDAIRLFWDSSCWGSESNFNLIVGNLTEVADYTLQWSECAIGTFGAYNWSGVPAGDLYFLLIGVDECSIYESSWGTNSYGEERNGTAPSNLCGVTTKTVGATCR